MIVTSTAPTASDLSISHRLLFNADQESLQRKVQRPRRQADIRHHVTGLGALGLLGWRRKRKQAA